MTAIEGQRQLLTVQAVADRLSLSRSKVYELIAAGRIGTVHIGRACRVTSEALDAFIESLSEDGAQ